ncbi:MAG TPA: CRTAC1 family protein [Thermoanaerobaculia bacterium]|jgi:hypothetical protein|nr:CRTAC1 family protein [Thermoanaerobaculia bacterium]
MKLLKGQLVRFLALAMILALYGFTRQPRLDDAERRELASRFAFTKLELPAPPGDLSRTVRAVHPTMERISGWISSVGAGVALNDFDGDGLNNDLCSVDVRVDRVQVAPVPGTGTRFAAFTLDPDPALPHDRRTMAPMGCVPGDWNEDGRMDAVVYYWGRPPVIFLKNDGALSPASFKAVPLAPGTEIWNTNALTSADVDGDGHLDLIVGNYFPDGARILDAQDKGTEHMHKSMSRSENGGVNRLYLGTGRADLFREVPNAFDPQTTNSWTLAAGAADLDGDLLPEIYFGNDFGNDRLLFNRSTPGHPRFEPLIGHKGFTTPTSKVLGRDSFKGMGIDFVDMNGDGRLDMYVSNIAQNWALEESHFVWVANGGRAQMEKGVAPFEDRSEDLGMSRSGWGWDSRFADFDADGVPEGIQAVGFLRGGTNRWPELHEIAMGNDNHMIDLRAWHHFQPGDDLSGHLHNPFWVRASDGRYYDLAEDVGLGQEHVSRGIALADVDHDGDLDFAVANQWESSWFYRNETPHRRTPNASLVLDVRVPNANGTSRPAVGAEVRVRKPDGTELTAQVDGGSGHSGKRAPEVFFGLGGMPLNVPLEVKVRWRDGSGKVGQQEFYLKPGVYTLVLGSNPVGKAV